MSHLESSVSGYMPVEKERRRRSRWAGALALSALCSLLALGCTAWSWSGGEEIAADLIDGFGAAMVEDAGFAAKYADLVRYEKFSRDPYGTDSPRLVRVGFEIDSEKMFENMRRSVYLGAARYSPCRIVIPVNDDAGGGTLVFSLAGLDVRNARCDLSIAVLSGGKREEIFRAGGNGIPERTWRDCAVDLRGISLDDASIELRLSSASAKAAHVFLANPRNLRA